LFRDGEISDWNFNKMSKFIKESIDAIPGEKLREDPRKSIKILDI